jgi:hypothetical protein
LPPEGSAEAGVFQQLCYCGGRKKNPVVHIFAEAVVSMVAPAGSRIDLKLTEGEQPKLVLRTSYEIARFFASMASLYIAPLRCAHDCPRGGTLSPQHPEDEIQILPGPGPSAEQQPLEGEAAAALVRALEPPRARSRAAAEGIQPQLAAMLCSSFCNFLGLGSNVFGA